MASAQTVEFDSDRLSNDFDRVTFGAENYRFCQAICQDTNQCVAWTYTPSGFGDYETPQCWLKDRVPRAFERKQSVSGTFPARMAERGFEEGEQPPSDAAATAAQDCRDQATGALALPMSMCMSRHAQQEFDTSICDALDGQDRENCHYSTDVATMDKCLTLEDENRQLCQMTVAVEFESPLACTIANPEFRMECRMIMASESGNYDILLDEVRYLPSEERDGWIAGLAGLTQNYDFLELIEDNRIRDTALTYISGVRIGAGKYVAPSICGQLVGGYSDADGGLNAASNQKLCHASVAMAHVMTEYAENHSPEEILALQNGMMEYLDYLDRDGEIANGFDVDPLAEDFDPNNLLPPGTRDAMDRALTDARSAFAAASVTQSGYTDPAPPSAPPPSGLPSGIPATNPPSTRIVIVYSACAEMGVISIAPSGPVAPIKTALG